MTVVVVLVVVALIVWWEWRHGRGYLKALRRRR
jgi:hypothetical protein